MFQILHLADLHLDTAFAASFLPSSVNSWRRADLRATLGRILTLARERQVDAVTIGGDLYEQDYALPETADFLAQQFAKLAPIRVFVAPGERDPYTSDSLYALTRWPENVTVFSQGKLTMIDLAQDIHLWGAACPPPRENKALRHLHVDRQGVNLLLLHAADNERGESEGAFSMDASSVRDVGFAVALLGHAHQGRIWPEDSPCCIYPGSPEPLVPGEADGTHGAVLLKIDYGICTPEFISTSQWRFRSLNMDLTACESLDDAVRSVEQAVQNVSEGDDDRLICDVTLSGSPDFDLDLTALAAQVTTKAHVRYMTRLSLNYDLGQLAQEQTVRGLLVRRFQERMQKAGDDRERGITLNALNYALQALDGKQVWPNEVD